MVTTRSQTKKEEIVEETNTPDSLFQKKVPESIHISFKNKPKINEEETIEISQTIKKCYCKADHPWELGFNSTSTYTHRVNTKYIKCPC